MTSIAVAGASPALTSSADTSTDADRLPAEPEVESDLLVEDVSIDGMCGVY